MRVLFIHQNMPGQYKHIACELAADPQNEVVFITRRKDIELPGIKKILYEVRREPQKETHRYLITLEKAILYGQEVWRACKALKDKGFMPDIICAHPGWGEAMFVKDIFPDTPLLNYLEFYYNAHGADSNFDPEDPLTSDDMARIRVKNCNNLLALESCDWGISPTYFQANVHPSYFRYKMSILHDGINTQIVKPNNDVTYTLPNGKTLHKNDEIITYVARNFEPYRGFPTAVKALEILQKRRPNAHIIMVGADGVSYGKKPEGNKTYRQIYFEKANLDFEKLHVLGSLPYPDYLKVIQLSTAHIYLTFPFVLSWSMLESMAAGCALVASRTSPVLEVIEDGVNGLLADFFSPEDVADKVCAILEHKDRMQSMRLMARKTVEDFYDLNTLLPLHIQLIRELAQGHVQPPIAQTIAKQFVPPSQLYLSNTHGGRPHD
ncbi:MAG: glycosyltransferase family 4 protein [Alphaproteobacteria bacterium]|nr:glycosyltransferase family 4 protein [Alphaproteobacteria bacterium]